MFETPEQFRERIQNTLKGTFSKEASSRGVTTLSEVDPQNQQGQKNVQAPPQQAKFAQSIQAALENLSMAFKAKGQLESGTKLKNAGSSAQKSIDAMFKAANDPNMDMKALADAFKKNFGNVLDSVVKDVETLSKKNQQQQQGQQQQSGQQPQQLNAEEGHGDNLQVADEAYGDGVKNHVGSGPSVGPVDNNSPIAERNDPISVDAMQGILKFATPGQIADAIKKMTPEDFQQFTNGLQKTALDVIAKSVNAGGSGGPVKNTGDDSPSQGKNNNPTGSGGNTDKEGNLKLGDL